MFTDPNLIVRLENTFFLSNKKLLKALQNNSINADPCYKQETYYSRYLKLKQLGICLPEFTTPETLLLDSEHLQKFYMKNKNKLKQAAANKGLPLSGADVGVFGLSSLVGGSNGLTFN